MPHIFKFITLTAELSVLSDFRSVFIAAACMIRQNRNRSYLLGTTLPVFYRFFILSMSLCCPDCRMTPDLRL